MGEAGEERANFFPACNRCLHCAAGQLQWGVSQVSILYLVGCLAVFTFDMTEGEDLVGCPTCYGRLAVVSDVDDGGVCPECRQGVERICRAISKQVQRSDARIEVDVMHTWNECTEQAQRMY
jgi:hypothetical protein